MANEYLKRTPTSTGNRKVWTLALWLKRNAVYGDTGADAIFNAANTATNSHGTDIRFRKDNTGNNNGWNFYDYNANAFTWAKYGDTERRDSGNWFHAMFVFDSTKPRGDDRVEVYINGVLDTTIMGSTYDVNPSTNYETYVNSITEHYLGVDQFAGSLTTSYSKSQFSDVFLVDGQALTPDVFGFNKNGDGYISVGSTQATDFRPGQWSPHSPRKIKTEIERRGGFGVNGFYLPMNDSSNFGADFHCTPNSIIKLKGEDLPQPRNGAPTTSDNYVSQLRSDPYAANLVLAVPGVNTQPTGSELITNGTFDTDVSGWTITDTGTIVRQSDGTAKVTRGSSAEVVYQDITTVVGTTYELSVDITDIAGSHGQIYVRSTYHSGSLNTTIGYSFYTGTYKGTFTADTTTTRIILYAHPSGSTSYDNISVKATTIRDYSADIKGSGTNKTFTPAGDAGVRNPNGASGLHVNGYYGSALHFDGTGDYFDAGSSSDFDFGSGDFTVEYWQYANSFAAAPGLGIWDNANNQRSWLIYQNSSRLPRFYTSVDGTNSIAINASSPTIPTNQWNHFCMERNGSNLVGYVNGVCVGVNTTLGTQSIFTPADPFWIGRWSTSNHINGRVQDLRVYKGVAKYRGGFDVPKSYSPVGIESWRQSSDTCNGNNFATMNPLASTATHTNGGLTVQPSSSLNYGGSISNLMVNSGKWYCELRFDEESTGNIIPGISELENLGFRDVYGGASGANFFGQSIATNDTAGVRFNVTANDGDIISMYMDLDSSPITCSIAVNGSTVTTYNSNDLTWGYNNLIPGRTYGFVAADAQSAVTGIQFTFNFGQNPSFSGQTTAGTYTDANGKGLFKYQPPTGYLALCEDNLPTPAIADPGKHFKTVLYTGTASSRAITGVGFKPDLVWLKSRSSAFSHFLFDSVRGATNNLISNLTDREAAATNRLLSFDSDGFSLGNAGGSVNGNGENIVAWCWKAGGNSNTFNVDGTGYATTSAAGITDGSIPLTGASVNTSTGFSILSYTGNGTSGTVAHGLGKTPNIVICKNRTDDSTNWSVNGNVAGLIYGTNKLILQQTGGIVADTNEVTGANATTITLGNSSATNDTTDQQIAYCWTEVSGFSKFGSYTGIGGSNGAFINCGFKPAFLMIKRTDAAGEWWMYDNSRGPINPIPRMLMANSDALEQEDTASYLLDFVSNGFKWRSGLAAAQGNGNTFLYMAFAESPLQTANAK